MFLYTLTITRAIPVFIAVSLAFNRQYASAAGALVVAVWCDAAVGLVKKRAVPDKNFQLHLEGFVDFFSFVASPVFFLLLIEHGIAMHMAAFIFTTAGMWRISRFNVEGLRDGCYRGLPVTYNGYLIPLVYFIVTVFKLAAYQVFIFGGVLLLVAGLMVSSIKVKEIS
jgi:phosphatidylserine synthase